MALPVLRSVPSVSTVILRTATLLLMPLLLLVSIFLLLRGHNLPGGGFSGGLVGSAAFILYAIAYDVAAAQRLLRVNPRTLIGTGLLLAVGSGLPAVLRGEPFMRGNWGDLRWIGLERIKVGTPLLFDVGVYLTVIGMVLMTIFALAEDEGTK